MQDINIDQQVNDILNEEPATQKEPAQTKKTRAKNGEIVKASERVGSALANKAERLLETEKKAKETRTNLGISAGLKEAEEIRAGKHLGLIEGLTRATIEDTNGIAQQLMALYEYTDENTDISESIEALEAGINPLDFAGVEQIPAALPTSKQRLNLFG